MKSPREALQPEAAPPPPPSTQRRKRTSLTSVLSGLLSFVIVAVVVVAIAWSFLSSKITAPGPLPADKTVNIPKGDDVAATLEENGVVDSALLLKATLAVEHNSANVKAGEYLFKQNASLQDVIDTLVSGKQVLHALTIPEGLTSQQVADRMSENDILIGDLKAVPPEGSLMPDTYKFARGTTREQLVRTMQQEARKVVADVWAHRAPDTVIRSPYDLVTLASIVEKETGKADERPRVAGVFINRLRNNIPLQSDPTIVYGLVGGKGTLGRGILKSEVEQKTPYNTYTVTGLPPGPIANPGKAALEAVANPSRTRELYFVADGTGGHSFAETLDQHRANVARWRQIERDAKDKVAPDAAPPAPAGAPSATAPKNQRGEADPTTLFGGLGQLSGGSPGSAQDRFAAMPLSAGNVAFAPAQHGAAAQNGNRFDDLDIEVDGVRSKEAPPVFADTGSAEESAAAGSLMTFPVSPQRQAEMRARESAYGLPSTPANATAEPGSPVQTAAAGPTGPLPDGRPRIFDASEGTALDPLRDRGYDLSSAKTVPTLKALPPIPINAGAPVH